MIEFDIEEAIEIAGPSPLGWRFMGYSRLNPA